MVNSFQGHLCPRLTVILAMGHFDPWSFQSLGRFDVVTFWHQVILILFHFDDPSWNTSVPGHYGPRALYPRIFWSLFIMAWDISVPSHFNPGSCQSQVIWFLGHFDQGSIQFVVISVMSSFEQFIPGSFWSLVILAMGNFVSGHFGPCDILVL